PRHRPPHQPHALQDRPHHGRRARRARERARDRAPDRAADPARRRSRLTVAQALSCGLDSREARLLLAHATGFSEAAVVAYPERSLPPEAAQRFMAFAARRHDGEPVAYIL